MKKLLAMSMALIMMAGLTGCGKGGYSSKSKKAITAAESAFDVEEMSNKEKKQFLKNNLRVGTGGFVDGLYVTLDEDDMESIDVDDDSETEIGRAHV